MPFAFGRDRRLRRHQDVARAQREGRRVKTPQFTLLVAPQPLHGTDSPRPARLALVVSRKVGGAVERNRVKRLCRECFRTWPDLLPPGADLVVIAHPGAADIGLEVVRAQWRAASRSLQGRAQEALARSAASHHVGPAR